MIPETSQLLTTSLPLVPQSVLLFAGIEYAAVKENADFYLAVLADENEDHLTLFEGERTSIGKKKLVCGPRSAHNIAILRSQLPWLQPRLIGLQTSAGMGDRLGLATPGHVQAIRKVENAPVPIFAQQSIREMARSGRSPQQVMDDATWGVFQENWQGGFGADADHLKTTEDIDSCLEAGYTFFTIDPGDHVDNRAETASLSELREMVNGLPVEMQLKANGLLKKTFQIEHIKVTFEERILLKAMAKYGRAVWHVAAMCRHLVDKAGEKPFELEVSVDETAQPTSHAEHVYIASELKRLGVSWVSLAPRYIGTFEKGVDYIGDVAAFEEDIAGHAAIARCFGQYKLSLHSGSDKFSIYPAAMRQTHGLVHLKTAGTSYLEALRTVADIDADLFREIYTFAREHYETDKVSYHVSAQLVRAPLPEEVEDGKTLFDQFDAREIMHVTFGSVLKAIKLDGGMLFRDRLMKLLYINQDKYTENLEKHFVRHLSLFTQK
jgi:hypothetical protein